MSSNRKRVLFPIALVIIVLVSAANILFESTHLENFINHSWYPPSHPNHVKRLGNFSIHVHWHPKNKSDRFPSIEDRIRLYMTNWYHAPCQNSSIGSFAGKYRFLYTLDGNNSWPMVNISDPWESSNQTVLIDSFITPDRTLLLDRPVIEDCARSREEYKEQGNLTTSSRVTARWNMQTYCTELIVAMDIMKQLDDMNVSDASTPIISYFGDGEGLQWDSFDLPLFIKHRPVATKKQVERVAGKNVVCTTNRPRLESVHHQDKYAHQRSPILWKLSTVRHWDVLPQALGMDRPWRKKIPKAFWGGDFTGKFDRDASDLEKCESNLRCRFVLHNAHSKLLDVRLTNIPDYIGFTNKSAINGTNLLGPKVRYDVIQQYKIIVSLEGNDLASGLKWSLQSESVVLMPPPTRTSWAMEELLEPWVHYVPMHADCSNAEEMVHWILDHDQEAQRIAERATLFMWDLVYNPNAESDDRIIKEEIIRRYRALWH